jgi:hypothetical protein
VCQSHAHSSDLLLLHGHIYTGNTKMPWADTAGIAGNPLDGVGNGGAALTGAVYTPEESNSVEDAVDAYRPRRFT